MKNALIFSFALLCAVSITFCKKKEECAAPINVKQAFLNDAAINSISVEWTSTATSGQVELFDVTTGSVVATKTGLSPMTIPNVDVSHEFEARVKSRCLDGSGNLESESTATTLSIKPTYRITIDPIGKLPQDSALWCPEINGTYQEEFPLDAKNNFYKWSDVPEVINFVGGTANGYQNFFTIKRSGGATSGGTTNADIIFFKEASGPIFCGKAAPESVGVSSAPVVGANTLTVTDVVNGVTSTLVVELNPYGFKMKPAASGTRCFMVRRR